MSRNEGLRRIFETHPASRAVGESMTRLSAEELRSLRAAHVERDACCVECVEADPYREPVAAPWPCDASKLLAHLDALADAVEALPSMPMILGPWPNAGTADAVLKPAVLRLLRDHP